MSNNLKWLSIVGLLTSACFFSSVGEDLEQQSCVGEPRSFCDELNRLSPTGDTCLSWSCDPNEGICKPLPLDKDGDGAPAMECTPEGVEPDCDDDDAKRTPIVAGVVREELCDGLDNDCDGEVDEGAYRVEVAASPLLLDEKISHFSVAQNSSTLDAQFVYVSSPDKTTGPAIHALPSDTQGAILNLTTSATNQHLAQSTALQYIEGLGMFALTSSGDGGRNTLRMGVLNGGSWAGGKLDIEGVQIAHLASSASHSSTALVGAYLNHEVKIADFCADLVHTKVMLFKGDTNQLSPADLTDFELGLTKDPSSPGIVTMANEQWLVALANENKEIELHWINQANFDSASSTPLMTLNLEAEPGELSLAANKVGNQVALAYRKGCGNFSSVHLALFSINESNQLSLQKTIDLPSQGGGHPRLLWRESPSPAWLISWTEKSSVAKLAHVLESGQIVGVPYTLLEGQTKMVEGVHLLHKENHAITAYAPSAKGLQQVTLSCSPSP